MNKTITIEWGGEAYSTLVDMRLIFRIEEKVNLRKFVAQYAADDTRYSQLAMIIAAILNYAGCKVSDIDIFNSMFGGSEATIEDIEALTIEILGAVFPDTSKKKDAKSLKAIEKT